MLTSCGGCSVARAYFNVLAFAPFSHFRPQSPPFLLVKWSAKRHEVADHVTKRNGGLWGRECVCVCVAGMNQP